MRRIEVKACGLTSVEDARMCVDAGVDALGLNFWPGTPRRVDTAVARAIVEAFPRVESVGVFVDASLEEIRRLRDEVGFEWVQLHGDEDASVVEALGPKAYKALGIAGQDDLARVAAYPGPRVLLDARVPGAMPGGTGHTFDWALAVAVARERELTLAGGLTPTNVAQAIARVRPHRVDVASGIERAPGLKDPDLVHAFVQAVRATQLGG